MKDGKPETLGECLEVMEAADSYKGREVVDEARWQALAIFLREIALAEGCDLDYKIEEPEPMKPEEIKRKWAEADREEDKHGFDAMGKLFGGW